MPILYIETNFLMSYATGRDAATDRLLSDLPAPARFVLPSCCIMEAFSALEAERARRKRFAASLNGEIGQIQANAASPRAQSLIRHLGLSLVEFQVISDDFEARMQRAIDILAQDAVLIDPSPAVIRSALSRIIVDDPTDNLILRCILDHAAGLPAEAKAFLTENSKCFYKNPKARAALDASGIKYFADPSKCLEWSGRSPESRMEG